MKNLLVLSAIVCLTCTWKGSTTAPTPPTSNPCVETLPIPDSTASIVVPIECKNGQLVISEDGLDCKCEECPDGTLWDRKENKCI
jgi:hypothetical protein